jgi:hypothetical protein
MKGKKYSKLKGKLIEDMTNLELHYQIVHRSKADALL